jgi:hypothetical protein
VAEVIGGLARRFVAFGLSRGLTVVGLSMTLIGAGLGARGVWVNESGAIEIEPSQWSTVSVFGLIAIGTALQIAGVFIPPRLSVRDGPMAPVPPPARPPTPKERDPRRVPRQGRRRHR